MKDKDLLYRLLHRGDDVAVERGLLVIRPTSGKPVPPKWVKEARVQIITEVSRSLQKDAFIYQGYTTGFYVKGLQGGITLRFLNVATDESMRVNFNVDLTRATNTEFGKAGTNLPKGKFRVRKGSKFLTFWNCTGLKEPPRLSSFSDYLGNLKGVVLTGSIGSSGRINKDTLLPLDITRDELIAVCGIQRPDGSHTNPKQSPYKSRTNVPYKDAGTVSMRRALQPIEATCTSLCDTSNQGSTDIRGNVVPIDIAKDIQDKATQDFMRGLGEVPEPVYTGAIQADGE